MKKTAIFIGMIAITMAMSAQSMKVSMEGDDPAQWERHYLNTLVDQTRAFSPENYNLDSIVDNASPGELAFGARIGSRVLITNDSLSVDWKTSRWKRKFYYSDFQVDKVETAPSPLMGYQKTIFHLIIEEDETYWNEKVQAVLFNNDSRYMLYIYDDEIVHLFKGHI